MTNSSIVIATTGEPRICTVEASSSPISARTTMMKAMVSVEGERVPLSKEINPAETGAVELWLLEFEDVMKQSLQKITAEAVSGYGRVSREETTVAVPFDATGKVVASGVGRPQADILAAERSDLDRPASPLAGRMPEKGWPRAKRFRD